MLKTAARLGACGLLLLSACDTAGLARNGLGGPARLASDPAKVGAGADWAAHGAADDESDYSRLDQINTANVGRLGIAWSMELPGEVTLEGTPLAVDGVLYFNGTYGKVYAVEGATGKTLWTYDPQVWKNRPLKMLFNFAASRGLAYGEGKIFLAALDTRVIALDAKTGRELWVAPSSDSMSPYTTTGAPRYFKGKVIIGNGGADMGARGYVTAFDAATGKQAWRFYVTPGTPEQNKGDPVMERAAATWNGEYWKTGTGGGPWDSITFDAELNRIYIGTANAGPYDPDVRSPGGGDNLYTASVVALDADTGKYVWHYQVNPRDSWDFDATQQMTLADLTIDGKPRKVLMQAPKNGFFYVLDRTTGKVLSAGKIGKATWAERIDLATGRPVEAKDIRYETGEVTIWPSPAGAHSWQSMAFSPKTGLVYIPYMQTGVHFVKGKPMPGGTNVGGLGLKEFAADPQDGKGQLVAYDPVRQTRVWTVQHEHIWNGGVLATAGGLVFQGVAEGGFAAYDAQNGRKLWESDVGMGIIASPMTYSVGGRQYVSVLAGYGGSAAAWGELMNIGWKYSHPRRLVTFALDGKGALPPAPQRDPTVHPVDDPSIKIDAKDVAAGQAMFIACGACHGRNLVAAGGPAPDLRESQVALDPYAFYAVVHDGALMQNGMPKFAMMTRPQIMQLYAYVRAGAREALAAQKAQASR